MSDIPMRLRSLAAKAKYRHSEADEAMVEAAARIEQLERELAGWKKSCWIAEDEANRLRSAIPPSEILEQERAVGYREGYEACLSRSPTKEPIV